MRPVALLFAGQGAQRVGMGRDFFESSRRAREMFTQADGILGFALSQVMFEGPENELTRTSRCQPALFLHGLIALELLRERRPDLEIAAAAGLSLGEFTAHAAAGSFTFEDGLRLVAQRGAFMEEACATSHGAMAAMLGGERGQVEALAAACGVDVANFNAPGQIVLSGPAAGIDAAVERAREFGLRGAVPLKVAGAYHSRLMEPARVRLAAVLATVPISPPAIPVVSNVDAAIVTTPDEIRSSLARQVTGAVRWDDSIHLLRGHGHETFLELGPGRVLKGLVGKIDRAAAVHPVEDLASLEAAAIALANE